MRLIVFSRTHLDSLFSQTTFCFTLQFRQLEGETQKKMASALIKGADSKQNDVFSNKKVMTGDGPFMIPKQNFSQSA